MTFELAVSAEMVFTDLEIIERVRRISELGFAVEIWSWHDKDLDALAATGATVLVDDRLPARRSLSIPRRARSGADRRTERSKPLRSWGFPG